MATPSGGVKTEILVTGISCKFSTPVNLTWTEFGIALGVIFGFMLLYVVMILVVGYYSSIRPVCPAGYRAISVDGSRSIPTRNEVEPNNIVTPDRDYPVCSPMLSCPVEGQKWAIHKDGSALTNSCDVAGCPCSAFQHCPAYSSTLFRQFGFDDRISLFQVIDPLAKDKTKPQDPYDVPYVLLPGSRDSCFLTPTTINKVWPALALGDKCIRGTLGSLSTNPSLYVCAPTHYVHPTTHVFDVDGYMAAYRTN